MSAIARSSRTVLLVAACSLLLVGATGGFADPEVTPSDRISSARLVSSAIRISRLEEKLNETWSRVRLLQATDDASKLLPPDENGITTSSRIFLCQ
jgi:hypothetical protein